jgi:hypothetical protein
MEYLVSIQIEKRAVFHGVIFWQILQITSLHAHEVVHTNWSNIHRATGRSKHKLYITKSVRTSQGTMVPLNTNKHLLAKTDGDLHTRILHTTTSATQLPMGKKTANYLNVCQNLRSCHSPLLHHVALHSSPTVDRTGTSLPNAQPHERYSSSSFSHSCP